MTDRTTEAWVLPRGSGGLARQRIDLAPLGPDQVRARPLLGCWEGNMDHAIRRSPVNVCEMRGEDRVVLGNAGVVEILEAGNRVTTARPGDVCLLFCNGQWDEHGYPTHILGYDAPGTVGLLARELLLHQQQVIPVPRDAGVSLEQWAGFSLRYITAWANWQVAWRCFSAQMREVAPAEVVVLGWGGGVALAELTLARAMGCRATMVASTPARLALLDGLGLETIDRSRLDPDRFEEEFLEVVAERTGGKGVSIFIDNLGVYPRATLKALGRQGVITTSGWKHGTVFPVVRARECISRHIHVFTHYARRSEGLEAVGFALENHWVPPVDDAPVYRWDDVPRLAEDYAAGRIDSYFPLFSIHSPASSRG